jgi:hypothetical protein
MAAHGFSQRHACRRIEVAPKTVRRAPVVDAPEVRQRLGDLAGERRRFGCRRGDLIKVLWHDGRGFSPDAKRLERGLVVSSAPI